MTRPNPIRTFGLYGDGAGVIEPEFAHIETISARSGLHNWMIAPHIHPGIFQLVYLTGGEGWLGIDGSELHFTPPFLVIVPCGCTHAFRFTPQASGWVLSVADALIGDARLAGLNLDAIARGGDVLCLSLAGEPARSGLLDTLLAEFGRRHGDSPGHLPGSTMALIGLVLSTAEELAAFAEHQPASGQHRRIALVRRFTRLVEQHYHEHWAVERYADALGTTAPTLTRACREVTGKPPGKIALDRLLREAMRSLSYTTASIGEISDNLGFADPAYFARIFRRQCGITASAFRRERVWMASSAPQPGAAIPRE